MHVASYIPLLTLIGVCALFWQASALPSMHHRRAADVNVSNGVNAANSSAALVIQSLNSTANINSFAMDIIEPSLECKAHMLDLQTCATTQAQQRAMGNSTYTADNDTLSLSDAINGTIAAPSNMQSDIPLSTRLAQCFGKFTSLYFASPEQVCQPVCLQATIEASAMLVDNCEQSTGEDGSNSQGVHKGWANDAAARAACTKFQDPESQFSDNTTNDSGNSTNSEKDPPEVIIATINQTATSDFMNQHHERYTIELVYTSWMAWSVLSYTDVNGTTSAISVDEGNPSAIPYLKSTKIKPNRMSRRMYIRKRAKMLKRQIDQAPGLEVVDNSTMIDNSTATDTMPAANPDKLTIASVDNAVSDSIASNNASEALNDISSDELAHITSDTPIDQLDNSDVTPISEMDANLSTETVGKPPIDEALVAGIGAPVIPMNLTNPVTDIFVDNTTSLENNKTLAAKKHSILCTPWNQQYWKSVTAIGAQPQLYLWTITNTRQYLQDMDCVCGTKFLSRQTKLT